MELSKGLSQDIDSESVRLLIESKMFEWTITALIIVNAITMGMETNVNVMQAWGGLEIVSKSV